MKYIQQHKQQSVLIAISLVLVILIALTIFNVFGSNSSPYGNRLDEVASINDTEMTKIKEDLLSNKKITTVNYNVNVKVIKFYIDTTATSNEAQAFANTVLADLNEKSVNGYDIEIYVTNSNSVDFPMIGYHSKSATTFSWVLNKAEVTSEE